MAEVEPLDNRSETHGLCLAHRREWLKALGISERIVAPPPP